MKRGLVWIFLVGAAGAVAGVLAVAARPASTDRCTESDASAYFQAPLVAASLRSRGVDEPPLVDSLERCQYRVFLDGATFTFREGDLVLGGIVWFSDYRARGLMRGDGIAELEAVADRVWLREVLPGGVLGPLVEQPLARTAPKEANHDRFGRVVYQHRAFTARLPAGEYFSFWEATVPWGAPVTATVRLVVLPE